MMMYGYKDVLLSYLLVSLSHVTTYDDSTTTSKLNSSIEGWKHDGSLHRVGRWCTPHRRPFHATKDGSPADPATNGLHARRYRSSPLTTLTRTHMATLGVATTYSLSGAAYATRRRRPHPTV